MRRHPTSTADIIGTAKALLNGASANADILQKYSLDPKSLGDLLDKYIQLDAKQERLKGDLHQTSADQRSVRKSLQAEFGCWVSVLEGQLGKNSEKLQEFGIPPRNLRPHKGPRAKATTTNPPANNPPANNLPAQPQVEA
jgi:hypothetical protein